jgi:NarL family two-component system response regulator LiaR
MMSEQPRRDRDSEQPHPEQAEHRVVRVMLADDHDVVRRGLAIFLQGYKTLNLVAEAGTGKEAVELCQTTQPDVILMDIMMPEMDGIEATRLIRKQHPSVQVIALTSSRDEDMVTGMLQAGAIGYLLKNVGVKDLADAILAAYEGKRILAPEATQILIDYATRPGEPQANLSERELEVLALMVKGLNNPQIAEKLYISRSTVKFHVSSILAKLDMTNRSEAIAYAVEHHLVK